MSNDRIGSFFNVMLILTGIMALVHFTTLNFLINHTAPHGNYIDLEYIGKLKEYYGLLEFRRITNIALAIFAAGLCIGKIFLLIFRSGFNKIFAAIGLLISLAAIPFGVISWNDRTLSEWTIKKERVISSVYHLGKCYIKTENDIEITFPEEEYENMKLSGSPVYVWVILNGDDVVEAHNTTSVTVSDDIISQLQ